MDTSEDATLRLLKSLSLCRNFPDAKKAVQHYRLNKDLKVFWNTINTLQAQHILQESHVSSTQGFKLIQFDQLKKSAVDEDNKLTATKFEKGQESLEIPVVEETKFELRYFWPDQWEPEIIYSPFLSAFKSKETIDQYILPSPNSIFKKRKGKLTLKPYYDTYAEIPRFSKKVREPEFIIEVKKNRSLCKLGRSINLELTQLSIQGKNWKTLCIESPNLEDVYAMAPLVNNEGAETMSYNKFLERFLIKTN